MARYVSSHNPVSVASLKRKPIGTVVVHHNGSWEDVRFARVEGGWLRERTDVNWVRSEVVTSAAVAAECNKAIGDKESWVRIY